MASSTTGATITLQSNDGVEFVVPKMVAMQFKAIYDMIEDDSAQYTIELPSVNAKILAKLIQFCKHHVEAEDALKNDAAEEGTSCMLATRMMIRCENNRKLKEWDMKFVEVDAITLIDLMFAAHYLNIRKLFRATCRKVAGVLKEKTLEEICQAFNIKNDCTSKDDDWWRFVKLSSLKMTILLRRNKRRAVVRIRTCAFQ